MTPKQRNELNRAIAAISAAERGPTSEELASAPRLDFWQPLLDPGAMPLLFGEVTDHPKLGTTTMTSSRLIAIDRKAGWARTISRWYCLDRPFADFEAEAIETCQKSGYDIRSASFEFAPFVPIVDDAKLGNPPRFNGVQK
ncbi:DUF6634 family protein [Paracoccus aminophilus]|uniref:DUF6634 family protein n=1 Tax=Paracoccus aminophilus TaxID=34003 RepID=UPI000684E13B|nr:DUF6634 family protein [Paracoccus aminophilus]